MSLEKVVVLAVLVGVGLCISLVAANLTDDWPGWGLNLGTELMGAGVIYFVLDQFIQSRERREAEERKAEQYKSDVIRRMGSAVHDVAIEAAEEARAHGWLTDGSLRGATLVGAKLRGAKLALADLQGAVLLGADLQGAFLWHAHLQGAYLVRANLQGAHLCYTDRQGVTLRGEFSLAKLDETTTLPDHTRWTPHTDMARFTDSDHPDFWRSDDSDSPAYEPKEQE